MEGCMSNTYLLWKILTVLISKMQSVLKNNKTLCASNQRKLVYIFLSVSKGLTPSKVSGRTSGEYNLWSWLPQSSTLLWETRQTHRKQAADMKWKGMWWKTKMSCAKAKWCRSSEIQRREISSIGRRGWESRREEGRGLTKPEEGISVSRAAITSTAICVA